MNTQDTETPSAGSAPTRPTDDEINVLDLLIVIAKHKRVVLGFPLIACTVSAVILLLMPNIYTATARIMPPQQNQSAAAAAVAAALGGLGGAGAIGSALGLKNPNDLYVAMLKSDSVADRMIERFNLRERFQADSLVEARKALAKISSITAGRDGLIVIAVDDRSPQQAADMANAYVEELNRLTQRLAVTEASQRRLFLERELNIVKENLAAAESGLKSTQERTGLIQPEQQGRAIFEAFAELRARIAAKETELAALRTFSTDKNPNLVRAQQELKSLREQLARLETAQASEKGNVLVPTTLVPEAGMEYLRRMRDVKYYETLFELLAKQYELAKIDEAKDSVIIQVVDKATPPDRKSKPKRALILALIGVGASIAAVIWAFVREGWEQSKQLPEQARRLEQLRVYMGRRR